MNALDSPLLEALAFDHVSFGLLTVVNNVWTWVAVVTAAVSVWKFRASSSPPRCKSCPDETEPSPLLISTVSSSRLAAEAAAEAGTVEEAAGPLTAAAPPSPPCVFNGEGRTSGKFTFYYDRMEEEEEEEEEYRSDDGDGEAEGGDGQDGDMGCEMKRFGEWWEVMMRIRMGEQMGGFYRYQDLTVLDGSVVRLWDGCRRRNGRSSGTPLI